MARIKAFRKASEKPALERESKTYPRVSVYQTGHATSPNPPRTFAMNSPTYGSGDCDVVLPSTYQFTIMVEYERDTITPDDDLTYVVERILTAKYPTLGIAGASFTWQARRRNVPRTGKENIGAKRARSEWVLSIAARPKLSQVQASNYAELIDDQIWMLLETDAEFDQRVPA